MTADKSWVFAVDLTGATWRCPNSLPPEGGGIEVAFHGGIVAVRNPDEPELAPHRFTPEEWEAFLNGVRNGEFTVPMA